MRKRAGVVCAVLLCVALVSGGAAYSISADEGDGVSVLFTKRQGNTDPGDGPYGVFTIDAQGGEAQRISRTIVSEDDAALSPDGRLLAFVKRRSNYTTDLFVLDLASDALTRITRDPNVEHEVSWAPDSESLAFAKQGPKIGGIYTANASGESLQRLTDNGHDQEPEWSPTGEHIAYTREIFTRGETQFHDGLLFLMNADGTSQRKLLRDVTDISPTWSPDGSRLALFRTTVPPGSYIELDVWQFDLATNEMTPIKEGFASNDEWSSELDWAPVGNSILVNHSPDDSDGGLGFYILDSSDGAVRPLGGTLRPYGFSVHWSPDGQHLAAQLSCGLGIIHVVEEARQCLDQKGAPLGWLPGN